MMPATHSVTMALIILTFESNVKYKSILTQKQSKNYGQRPSYHNILRRKIFYEYQLSRL